MPQKRKDPEPRTMQDDKEDAAVAYIALDLYISRLQCEAERAVMQQSCDPRFIDTIRRHWANARAQQRHYSHVYNLYADHQPPPKNQ